MTKETYQKRMEVLRAAKASKKGSTYQEKQALTKVGAKDEVTAPAQKYVPLDEKPGYQVLNEAVDMPCIWDEDITYELQLELLLVCQRLMEHFAAAAFSIQQCRPFDAVCIIVPGCIAAVADALMRRRAINHPSEACCQLMGQDVNGRQLGWRGFGISVKIFASQTETIECHSPELAVARSAVRFCGTCLSIRMQRHLRIGQ